MDHAQSRHGGARVTVPPPSVFLAALATGFLIDRFVARWAVPGGVAVRVALSALAIVAGLALGGPAIRLFRRTGQDPRPWHPTPELVLRGPYRFTRNPMYVGLTLLTIGLGVALGTLWTLPLAFAALAAVHVLAVLPEERYLTARFGAPYLEYKARVRRYL
jgi:protein-S-isoprenylcysteine O-methyltransferase Ste14